MGNGSRREGLRLCNTARENISDHICSLAEAHKNNLARAAADIVVYQGYQCIDTISDRGWVQRVDDSRRVVDSNGSRAGDGGNNTGYDRISAAKASRFACSSSTNNINTAIAGDPGREGKWEGRSQDSEAKGLQDRGKHGEFSEGVKTIRRRIGEV